MDTSIEVRWIFVGVPNLREPKLIFLKRLVDRDGRLTAHSINPDTDLEVILALEQDMLATRDTRDLLKGENACTGVTITEAGSKYLANERKT